MISTTTIHRLGEADIASPRFSYILNQLSETKLTPAEAINAYRRLPTNINLYGIATNNQLLGIGTILIEPKFIHNLGIVGHIEDVVVDKDHRTGGYGKQLIIYLVTVARNAGCYKVILNCNNDNISFYERCGFKQHGCEMRINL